MTHPILTHEEAFQTAEAFGTPIYVYSEKILREQARSALAFPAPFGLTVRYAMKANPNRSILRILNEEGIHMDASSGYEAERAMLAGTPAENILLTAQELPQNLEALVKQGVQFTACSLHQLESYGKLFPGTTLSVRINPGQTSSFHHKLEVAGSSAGFGIWHEEIPKLHALLQKHSLTVTRLHTHIGSGTDPEEWAEIAKLSIELLHQFPQATRLNLGGGFKVARVPGEKAADLQEIGTKVSMVLASFAKENARPIHLEIEPGHYLVGNSGAILSRIQDLTHTTGQHFIKLDCGMTEILRPGLYDSRHPMTVFSESKVQKNKMMYTVIGHCCEGTDLLTTKEPVCLPQAEIGDLLLIGGAGAYCAGMSTKHYNSFPEAAEVLLRENGEMQLIRRRQSLKQLMENEL